MNPSTTAATLPETALARFERAIAGAIAALYDGADKPPIAFEAPRRPEFGDVATNVAFSLAKVARKPPAQVAEALIAAARERDPALDTIFASIEAQAGFVNLRFAPAVWHAALDAILRDGARYGSHPSRGELVSIEFGSANPTGPLVVVQGRTLSIGDALVRSMRLRGYDVFVEWIVNDAGGQVETLARSLYARYRQSFDPSFPFPEDGYPGEYLLPIADALRERDGNRWVDAPEAQWHALFSTFGRDALVAEQRRTAERFGVHYDLWQSEKELHDTGKVSAGVEHLRELGHTYEKDGALFFRATQFGDDKDRVLLRGDGRPTYYCADIAYHYQKLQRADRVIDILGPDHHGYIGRLQGLAEALGYGGHLHVLIAQQVTLMRGGEQVSMSKRAGQIVTLDETIDEVGVDAARFFFVTLAIESPLTFDLQLAVEQSSENPVYYVQYGHARIAAVLREHADPAEVGATGGTSLTPLVHAAELALIRRLAEFPQVVQGVVDHLAPHRLARYARDVATDFHQFYTACKILVDDRDTRVARLALCVAAKNVLKHVLDLIGVGAPDSM